MGKGFDVKTGQMTDGDSFDGLTGFVSWRRLAALLQEHEASPHELIERLSIEDDGIRFRVEIRK